MLKLPLITLITITTGLSAMDKPFRMVIDPAKNPDAFFNILDEQIQTQVTNAQQACIQRNVSGMIEYLKILESLLTTAQSNHWYVVDGYPCQGPLAQDAKRKRDFQDNAEQTYQYITQFKTKTQSLIKVLPETADDPITEEEWSLMQKVLASCLPEKNIKKSKSDSDN